MKIRTITILVSLIATNSFAQPSNDNCSNATTLTVGNLLCGQTTNNATVQAGEHCSASGGGITPKSVWYRFVASSTSMVVDVLRTNSINCFGYLSVYGPNPTCMPGAGSAILSCVLMNGDPGYYPQLTGLTVGATYYINYNGQGCGGSGDNFHNFCIGVFNTASNNTVNSPSVINQCGVAFNGTTQGGYSPSGTGVGYRDLDNNLATTCPSCGAQPGADVSYVMNNDSWFQFCSPAGGTWSLSFNVGSCVFSGVNSGLQMAVFTGTSSALTWHSQAPSPTYSGATWNSPTITLAAGACAYMAVDGFAGDACSYNYTLTNLTGGCILPLPIELISFGIEKSDLNEVNLMWETAFEKNNSYFTIERSLDGENFYPIGVVNGAGNSSTKLTYRFIDLNPILGQSYYRLNQTDIDGIESSSMIVSNYLKAFESYNFVIHPNPSSEGTKTFIELSTNKEDLISLEIMDTKGIKIFTNSIVVNGTTSIELTTTLNKGVYMVKTINSLGEVITKKFIVN